MHVSITMYTERNHLQVGATPEGVEVPRCVVDPNCLQTIEQQLPGHKATIPPGADPKWRFFWRLGPRPEHTQFAELNAEPVIPEGPLSDHMLLCAVPMAALHFPA